MPLWTLVLMGIVDYDGWVGWVLLAVILVVIYLSAINRRANSVPRSGRGGNR